MGGDLDQLFFAKTLQYYKRREVQEAILRHATDREISPRYGEGFGKRPDTLSYPRDVLEFAKRKATSFHASEERWDNPLAIKTGASRKEMDALRKGWDLVLDIDAKDWDISRLTAWLFVEALKAHGINGITCKFSGNKGWHIGVAFESFPATVWDENVKKDVQTKDLFPELPRAIAGYLVEFIDKEFVRINGETIIFGLAAGHHESFSITALAEKVGKQRQDMIKKYCPSCKKIVQGTGAAYRLECVNPNCLFIDTRRFAGREEVSDSDWYCPRCKKYLELRTVAKPACPHNPSSYENLFKIEQAVQFDTILLASRHLYRIAYSLHEKSHLASVVINPDDALTFDKKFADPKTIGFEKTFLDPALARPGEAGDLVAQAWRTQQTRAVQRTAGQRQNGQSSEFDIITEAVAEEHFPPCIRKILEGLADGKKRAMFALTNFFVMAGWTPDMIENRLNEWNKNNEKFGEPLREVIIKGHMRQVRMKKEKILPPNCKSFYQELGVCVPDEFCSRIRNPAQYAIKHSRLGASTRKRAIKRETKKAAQVSDGKEKTGETTKAHGAKEGISETPDSPEAQEGQEEQDSESQG